ncbi:MAG: N-acetylmuramic acid 6-phosphate etherase [Armatimonadota bacterium]
MQEKLNLVSESKLSKSRNISMLPVLQILKLMNKEDQKVAKAVFKEIPKIGKAVDKIIESFSKGGRLFYVGAGTSGRLAVVDASECPPTFGVESSMVQAIIAGGAPAVFKSKEGAEDIEKNGEKELKNKKLAKKDIVVGISASGRTPFVIGALKYAGKLGCFTVAVTVNKDSKMSKHAKVSIVPEVGPEFITGSTRLKAGTAQKLVLNMLTTVSMIKLGRTFNNLMVDLMPVNTKLKMRSVGILMELTGLGKDKAEKKFKEAKGELKTAVVMELKKLDYSGAKKLLDKNNGSLQEVLSSK